MKVNIDELRTFTQAARELRTTFPRLDRNVAALGLNVCRIGRTRVLTADDMLALKRALQQPLLNRGRPKKTAGPNRTRTLPPKAR